MIITYNNSLLHFRKVLNVTESHVTMTHIAAKMRMLHLAWLKILFEGDKHTVYEA